MDQADANEPPPVEPSLAAVRFGALAYRNWKAMQRRGGEPVEGAEYLLFSDQHATGGHWKIGPYEILNTVAGAAHARGAVVAPLALRTWFYADQDESLPSMEKTDDSAYTGMAIADEIAALLALITARRLHAGGMVRRFDSTSHPGEPYGDEGIVTPIVPRAGHRRLPRQADSCALIGEHHDLLLTYVDLPAPLAVGLARAARAYRDALWLGESQPELAWLLLVSAVECAANTARVQAEVDPLLRLRSARPELEKILTRHGLSDAGQRAVAKEITHLFKNEDKFVNFLVRYGPSAGPEPRPQMYAQFPWTDGAEKRAAFVRIYTKRSAALHAAVPLPYPMLMPPSLRGPGSGFSEVPGGLSARTLGATWTREHTPMLLHAFEFAVQGALVAWWRECARNTAPQGRVETEGDPR